MGIKRRVERLEATHNATGYQTPPELELYFKRLENIRREQAREPPIPLTPEEERWERGTDEKLRAYLEQLDQQRKERIWQEET
jgi:hypothetical protein